MFGVDVGGTFTDVVAVKNGKVLVTKVPSVPADPHRSVIEGARRLGVGDSAIFNHASTKGLNALLTRNLPKIGFITTDGHRDMLDAGRAWRPFENQLDATWRRSFGDAARPLVQRYLRRGVKERLLANGEVMTPLDEDDVRRHLELLKRCAVEGVAVCLINAYVSGAHERRIRELIRDILGDLPVSISSEVSPRAKEYARASTTVIDVMMKLMYHDYAHKLHDGLEALGFNGDLNFADCTASLLPWREALQQPHKILFAGPAAGTASCLRLGQAMEERQLICCDVGGTSTDVSIIMDGQPFTNDSFEIEHDLVINALSTEVSSVGAGGGSIVSISPSGDVDVGPGSAGAIPGAACYGRGGTLPTITDACLLMGIIDPRGFAGGQMELDAAAAQRAFASLDTPLSLAQRIAFAYRIAVNNIAEEVTNVAIRHGADPRDFSLVAYGAAGPMLLASSLDLLQVKRIIIPPYPGLFSALGLLSTDLVFTDAHSAYMMLTPESAPQLASIYETMESRLRARLGKNAGDVRIRRSLDGRLLGQTWETPFVEVPPGEIGAAAVNELIDRFHTEYERRNGQGFRGMPVQGVTYRVQLVAGVEKYEYTPLATPPGQPFHPVGQRELRHLAATPVQAAIYTRESLPPGAVVAGPAIVQEDLCTILVCPGQTATVGRFGELIIEAAVPALSDGESK